MPISALPSPYGIGTFGKAAFAFVDFLARAGQHLWQVLPMGPTGYGDSPYQSFSAIAGNPYFIDPEILIEKGLIDRAAAESVCWGDDPALVDYGRIFAHRFDLLHTAFEQAERDSAARQALDAFIDAEADWLCDYALFMAEKDAHGGRAWTEWETPLRAREEGALTSARNELSSRIRFHSFLQYLFFTQWRELKAYANANGVRIIGDIPIYVPLDSADVWASPQEFQLDAERRPVAVAGVPPDYFSADGQLWGNPLYDWTHMQETGFSWWKRRMRAASKVYDVLRIDHFRGISSYWRVPADAKTARIGQWVPGPGSAFTDMLHRSFPDTEIIAEDLGYLNDDVLSLVRDSGYPGMKVLQFAFDAREPSNYLPHTYPRGCVCYTGTHDNDTAAGWFQTASAEDVAMAVRYLGLNDAEGLHWGMIRGGMSSVADLFLAQMQDYLGLGSEARMNTPGTMGGHNWRWRMLPGSTTSALADKIAEYSRIYGRRQR